LNFRVSHNLPRKILVPACTSVRPHVRWLFVKRHESSITWSQLTAWSRQPFSQRLTTADSQSVRRADSPQVARIRCLILEGSTDYHYRLRQVRGSHPTPPERIAESRCHPGSVFGLGMQLYLHLARLPVQARAASRPPAVAGPCQPAALSSHLEVAQHPLATKPVALLVARQLQW